MTQKGDKTRNDSWISDISLRTEKDRISLLEKLIERIPAPEDLQEPTKPAPPSDTQEKETEGTSDTQSNLLDIGIDFFHEEKYEACSSIMEVLLKKKQENSWILIFFYVLSNLMLISAQTRRSTSEGIDNLIKKWRDIKANIPNDFYYMKYTELFQEKLKITEINSRKKELLTTLYTELKDVEPSPYINLMCFDVQLQLSRLEENSDEADVMFFKSLGYAYKALKEEPHNANAWNYILFGMETLFNFTNSSRETNIMIDLVLSKISSFNKISESNPFLSHNIANIYYKKATLALDESEQEALLKEAEKRLDESAQIAGVSKEQSNVLRAKIAITRAQRETINHKKISYLNKAIEYCESMILSNEKRSESYAPISCAYRLLAGQERDKYRKRYLIETAIAEAKRGLYISGFVPAVYKELYENYKELTKLAESAEETSAFEEKALNYKKLYKGHRI